MSALLGYARISTTDEDASLQHDALTAAGCARILSDTASGAHADRPELLRMPDYARGEDTIVVWRLDRLGRFLRNLVELVNELGERQIDLRSCRKTSTQQLPPAGPFFTCSDHSRSSSASSSENEPKRALRRLALVDVSVAAEHS